MRGIDSLCGLRGALLAGAMLASSGALAQAAAPSTADPDALDDIIVTSQFARQNLQDVPVAISAFGEAAINAAIPDTISDFQKFLPNVVLSDVNFSANTLAVSIRGISFADLEKTFENAIGVSIDGVFLGTNTGAAFEINDIESIEVLRGPQGTLQGRNSIGGALLIRRTRPTGELGARINARYGRYDNIDLTAVVNTPRLGDIASLKLFGAYKQSDSHTVNQVDGRRDGGKDYWSVGGAALLGREGGDWNALISLDYQKDDSEFAPPVNLTQGKLNLATLPPAAAFPVGVRPFIAIGAGGTICDATRYAFGSEAGCDTASIIPARDRDYKISFGAIPFKNEQEAWSATLEVNGKIGETTVTSITGYRESDELLFEENTGAPPAGPSQLPIFVAIRDQHYEQFSQELRFSSQIGERLKLVYGLYYLNTKYDIGPGTFAGQQGQAFLFGASVQNFLASQTLNSYAGFVEGTFDLTDTLRLTAGGRYTRDEKRFTIDTRAQATGAFFFTGKESWSEPTWRAILDWKPGEDALLYASYSRGFRAGGWNGRATSFATASQSYDPETVDSYEVGGKFTLADGRLRINPAAFIADYKNVQQDIIRAATPPAIGTETIVENAASARIKGFELEVQGQIGSRLNVVASLGLLDAKYRTFLIPDLANPGGFVDVTSQRQWRRAPDVTLNAGGNYTLPVGPGELVFNTNVSYIDEYATSPVRDAQRREIIRAQTKADFSLSYQQELASGSRFRLTGYIKDAFRDGGRLNTTLDAGLFWFGVTVPARTYGVEAEVRF